MPSKWCIDFWKKNNLCKDLNMFACPFGIDTERFCEIKPIEQRNLVFIYYKSRNPQELEFIENLLKHNNIQYRIFSYRHGYDENEYLQYLQNSKYGIWLDAHESQGFALEEALSCNVPLLVWNIKSMNQEFGQHYPDIPATTIPYWDERCGEYFYDMSDFEIQCRNFFNNLESYKPRKFILENLSSSVCEKRFMDMVLELKNNT
jgi:glycosyltransferase involved in cell wall biosynthesis